MDQKLAKMDNLSVCQWRVPVLGGPKSAILGQMSVSQPVFFNKFRVGCGTNCTATEKNMCVILCLYSR